MNEQVSYILFLLWISISAGIGSYLGWKIAQMTLQYRKNKV